MVTVTKVVTRNTEEVVPAVLRWSEDLNGNRSRLLKFSNKSKEWNVNLVANGKTIAEEIYFDHQVLCFPKDMGCKV